MCDTCKTAILDFFLEQLWALHPDDRPEAILAHKAAQARLIFAINDRDGKHAWMEHGEPVIWGVPVLDRFKLDGKLEWVAAETELSFVKDGKIVKTVRIPESA